MQGRYLGAKDSTHMILGIEVAVERQKKIWILIPLRLDVSCVAEFN